MPHILTILVAQSSSAGGLTRILLPLGVLVVAIVIGGAVIHVIRRALLGKGDDSVNEGFTLQDLRDMRSRGDISESEYDRARKAMISRVKQPVEDSDDLEEDTR